MIKQMKQFQFNDTGIDYIIISYYALKSALIIVEIKLMPSISIIYYNFKSVTNFFSIKEIKFFKNCNLTR